MRADHIYCDGCKAVHRESNNWWLVSYRATGAIRVEPWNAEESLLPDVKHICGVGCLLKTVQGWAETAISIEELERLAR